MERLFLCIISLSLTASYVIALIILVRLLLKRAPKIISYALWSVAAIRLLVPFTIQGIYSLIPRNEVFLPRDASLPQTSNLSNLLSATPNMVSLGSTQTVTDSLFPMHIVIFWSSVLWITGVALMFTYGILSIIRLKRRLSGAVYTGGNIYETRQLDAPFVMGIIRPSIYIPSGLGEEEKGYVITHELTHIRRFDHLFKLIAYILLCIHWFNPLVWIAFVLMSSDMELSCDEKVLKLMGKDIRKAYSTSLLTLAIGKRILNGSPLAFGEGNVKKRIKNVLNYKKTSVWIIVIAVTLAVTVGIGLLANPKLKSGQGVADLNTEGNNQDTAIVNEDSNTSSNEEIFVSTKSNSLENAIHTAIIKENADQYPDSDIITEAHTILKTVVKGNTTSVYAMVLYLRFNRKENSLEESAGSSMPVAMTFTTSVNGNYLLKEYWIPQDGSYYVSSIRKKFPSDIAEAAMDTQKYILAENQSCYAQAVEAAKVSVDRHLEEMVNTIASDPLSASNPKAYIDEHPIEYRELLYYSVYTLRYCYGLFEEGDQTGLKGQIMGLACKDILGKEAAKIKVDNGQTWYEAFKKNAYKQLDKHGKDYMKENMPGAVILLQMLGEMS